MRSTLTTQIVSFLIFFIIIITPPAVAEENTDFPDTDPPIPRATAWELRNDNIQIDGKFTESVWDNAQVLTGFIQNNPNEGEPASERTEVRVLYSQNSLYVGVRALDSDAGKIKKILARRDSKCPSDWIKIWIDSYHDHLTAFQFGVNPCGVKQDVYWSNDRRPDDDWDAVWDVEVSIDEGGWNAEFRIPFSQIRFTQKKIHTWGFQVSRTIHRNNETSFWRHIPKGSPRFVSLFGELDGIEDIPSPRRLQILPYTMGKGDFAPAVEGNPFKTGKNFLGSLGVNVKYGLTSNLTLDAAVNPDFGQVEADPAQVNLTAFETFFREKRPFFIEGKDMLNFPLGGAGETESLFYSRRIGRAPQGYPVDALYYQRADNTTILGAFKLTGKTSDGWSIGVMEALTSRENAQVLGLDGSRSEQRIEPMTNYILGRIKKEWRNGRTHVGAIFTAVNRKVENENLNFLRTGAYSGGLDFQHRWGNDRYEVSGFFIGSQIRGSADSIYQAQTSSARYFQRPDATHVEVDPDRTSLSGTSASFAVNKIGGEHWRWAIGGRMRSPGFEVNDMGYMRRADSITQYMWLSYMEFRPGKVFRDYNVSLLYYTGWNFAGTPTAQAANFRGEFRFMNYWSLGGSINRSMESISTSHLRGGPSVRMPGNWSITTTLRSDYQQNFFLNLRANMSLSDNGAKSYGFSAGFTMRLGDRIDISLTPGFNDGFRRLQYITKTTSSNQSHYVHGRIDQTTLSLTMRLNFTLTPNLSMQLYTQPYISAGKHSEYKEVIDPLASDYDDRWHIFSAQEISSIDSYYTFSSPLDPGQSFYFSNPDFNFRQFRLNLVIRWEYLPGSTLFLVWTNGMNDYADVGTLNVGDDLKGLFGSDPRNIFLIKVSYWFDL
ncbi:DUF5916 domain-containing protein [Acidobacteriota bacterium]